METIKFSPLFWPVRLKKDTIYILDETLLPHRVRYIKARSYPAACRAIKEMKTRAIGQVLLVLYTFLLALKNNKGRIDLAFLRKISQALNATRPTLSFKFLTDLVLNWAENNASVDKYILGFLEKLRTARVRQAEEVSKLLKDGDTILTHCNISGLMPLMGEFSRRQNKSLSFFVTETRPYLQGSRLTAWELIRAGFKVTIITDNMAAQVMQERKINKVIVGADNLARNGDIANKIGTYGLAVLAQHFKIPFYVVCPPTSQAKSGKDIKIEVRPDKEMFEMEGVRLAPLKAKGYYPAFDITPNKLITKHIYLKLK